MDGSLAMQNKIRLKHAFEMMMQDLKTQIKHGEADRDSKKDSKSKKQQAKADAEGDLTDVTGTRDADQKYMDDMTAECETKASDFVARQQLRTDEATALNKAMEIIGGNCRLTVGMMLFCTFCIVSCVLLY